MNFIRFFTGYFVQAETAFSDW